MFWTSSSWRETFTFWKRSIRTIRVTFRCCLFLAAKVLRTRTNSIRRFLWVKDSRIALWTYTFSTRNLNLDITFLKMNRFLDRRVSWIFICSLIENFPLLTLIGPCRKAKISEIRSFLTPTTTKSNSTILDHGTRKNKL